MNSSQRSAEIGESASKLVDGIRLRSRRPVRHSQVAFDRGAQFSGRGHWRCQDDDLWLVTDSRYRPIEDQLVLFCLAQLEGQGRKIEFGKPELPAGKKSAQEYHESDD
jgi:hypothetical protein